MSDVYRNLYLDKSDQLLNALAAAIELQQENERLRKMVVEFGAGKVGVMRTAEQGEYFDSGLAFVNQEAHPIGEVVPGRIGKTTDEVDCFLRFHFSNSESVQILIDDLIIVRDSIAGGRTLLVNESFTECPEGHGPLYDDGGLLFCPICKHTVST